MTFPARRTLYCFGAAALAGLAQVSEFDAQPYRERQSNRIPALGMPISGTILASSPSDLAGLQVLLLEAATKMPQSSAPVAANGMFLLTGVPAGQYELRVLDAMGAVVYSLDYHSGSPGHLTIPLATRLSQAGGSVSLQRLGHAIPKQARKLMEQARKKFQRASLREKEEQEAADLLGKALAIDPQYFDALAGMGALQLARGEAQPALDYLLRAQAIDPGSAIVATNLGAAHILLQRYAEAESAARRALALNPADARSHYILAMSLLHQNKNEPEAKRHLENACKEIPAAAKILARLQQGQPQP